MHPKIKNKKNGLKAFSLLSNYEVNNLCLSVYLFVCTVCLWHISRTFHRIYLTLGKRGAGDQLRCSVEFGAIWTCDSFSIYKLNKLVASSGAWLQGSAD